MQDAESNTNREEEISAPQAKRPPAFYAIRTTARQELNVALLLETRVKSQSLNIYSIIVPPDVRGYVILEAPGVHVIYAAIRDLRHVKGQAPGIMSEDEIKGIIMPKPTIELLHEGEEVEIIAGPFKGMKATVVRIESSTNEVVLKVLEAAYPLQITVPGDYVRPLKKKTGG